MYKIAISGKANSGKNTLAKMIVKELRATYTGTISASYLAFADPIKKMAMIMFPTLPKKWFFGPSNFRNEIIPGAFKDDKPLTVRQLLFDLGTQVGRGYQDNIWLYNFDEVLRKNPANIVITPDERFRNEFDHLKLKGFFQIRLYRPTDEPIINHISETGQDMIKDSEFDYVVHNDKSLKHLKTLIAKEIIPLLVDN